MWATYKLTMRFLEKTLLTWKLKSTIKTIKVPPQAYGGWKQFGYGPNIQQNDSTVVSQGNEQGRMKQVNKHLCAHTHTIKLIFLLQTMNYIFLGAFLKGMTLITAKGKLFPDYSRSTYIEEIMGRGKWFHYNKRSRLCVFDMEIHEKPSKI